ncbi:MAG TPA: amidase [Polyangiaceae bacterium]|nr:amidase [Polyangiaceae bacterium]
MNLVTLSAVRLAELIKKREISAREAVDAHIALAERVNPTLNAIVRTRFADARREADALDRKTTSVPATELPPFHGVPCTIKECFEFTGMPNSAGLVRRKHVVATTDATAVKRLRAAGAIPLGVTNVSELCMWMESTNRVYGTSNNPYDPTRIVGGSSGGEGAIVGSGASPFGLGSDIGGSIRGPAFFNGVFGHKPTPGVIPNSGQHPKAENEAKRFLTTGPLARRAEDLMPLVRVLAGPDGIDPVCEAVTLGAPESVSFAGRTLVSVEDNGRLPVSDELRAAHEQAVRALERRGMRVRTARPRALALQFDIWSSMMGLATDTPFGAMLGEGTPIRPLVELAKLGLGKSDHTIMAILLAITDPLPRVFRRHAQKLVDAGLALRREMAELMGDGGLWLYPSYTKVAPPHGQPVKEAVVLQMPFAYFGIVNVLHLPATQVPLGLGREGLPLGVQVIGRAFDDHVTIRAALELEQDFGGWVPPRGVA